MALIPYLANRGYFTVEEPKKGELHFRLQNNDFTALKEDERVFLEGMFPYEKEIGQRSVQYGVGFDRNHRRRGQHLRDENGRFLLGFRKALYARKRYSREGFDHSV